MNPSPSHLSASPWRIALPAFTLVLCALVAAYWQTASAIVGIWARSDTFAHGFFVLPIVGWLIWRRRQTLAGLPPAPGFWIWVLVALAGFGWLLGELAAVNALSQLAFVSMLILLVPAFLGYSVAAAIAFPLIFLFFGVPFGEFAMPQLMQWTADFTVLALRATGIPVYREGLQFVIPSGTWSVIEACSGIRYIIASLTVGTLFAYLNYQSLWRRALFILVSLLVPIVANWLRAYIIVILGHLSGNKLAAGVDHLIYGWVFFGLVIMLMFWIGARWSEPEPDPTPAAASVVQRSSQTAQPGIYWLFTGVALGALLAMPHIAQWGIQKAQSDAAVPSLLANPILATGWEVEPERAILWQPAFANPSAERTLHLRSAQQQLSLYAAYYRSQGPERKLVSSENVLVKSKDPEWAQVASGVTEVSWGNGMPKVQTAELRGSSVPGQPDAQRLVAWHFYWINGTLTSSPILAKAYTALYSLMGRGDDSAVLILYAPKDEAGQGESALSTFMQANAAGLSDWLRSVQSK